jgi:hypothetical protein
VELVAGDVWYLRRPGNFQFYNNTLIVKRFLTVESHGILPDDTDAEQYVIKLGGPTAPDTEVGIAIDVVLPDEPRDILDDNSRNRPEWLMECYDENGVPKATNDYLFPFLFPVSVEHPTAVKHGHEESNESCGSSHEEGDEKSHEEGDEEGDEETRQKVIALECD